MKKRTPLQMTIAGFILLNIGLTQFILSTDESTTQGLYILGSVIFSLVGIAILYKAYRADTSK